MACRTDDAGPARRKRAVRGALTIIVAVIDAGRFRRSARNGHRGFEAAAVPGPQMFDLQRHGIREDIGVAGIRASQEYAGRHEGIAARSKALGFYIEDQFVEICGRLEVRDGVSLGKQIALLFQGALLLAQVYQSPTPFETAKGAVEVLLKDAKDGKSGAR